MKQSFTCLACLLILSATSFAQVTGPVLLRWKLGPTDTLRSYTVSKTAVDLDTNSTFYRMFNSIETKEGTGKGKKKKNNDGATHPDSALHLLRQLQQQTSEMEFNIAMFWGKPSVLNVEARLRPAPPDTTHTKDTGKVNNTINTMMNMMPAVVLRGSLNADGSLHSFYLKTGQKNLISMWFELPTHPIKIGDSWTPEINLLSADQSLVCDSSYKRDLVTLKDIKTTLTDTIALIQYDLEEYMAGTMNMGKMFSSSLFNQDAIKDGAAMRMHLTYKGQAEFSITQGRWLKYTIDSDLESKGWQSQSEKKSMTLVLDTGI
jgi:hypothetical protein